MAVLKRAPEWHSVQRIEQNGDLAGFDFRFRGPCANWSNQRLKAMSEVDAEGLLKAANVLSRPAEEFGNDPALELLWAEKAYQHAEIHFNLLCSVDPLQLRLTPADEEIYKLFREEFPDMQVSVINEDEMKSPAGKEKWRIFCEKFKDKVEDYSFGTLLRLDCSKEYSPENTTLVTRIQFYAIESARNREGYNSGVRSKYIKKADIYTYSL